MVIIFITTHVSLPKEAFAIGLYIRHNMIEAMNGKLVI